MDNFSDFTDEELERIANGGEARQTVQSPQDFSDFSDEELERIAAQQQSQEPAEDPADADGGSSDYGFFDRQRDQMAAQRGNRALDGGLGAAEAVTEGVAPFQRGIQEGISREQTENKGAFLDGTAWKDAIERHGEEEDESLRGYKAKEIGAVETGVRQFGHELSAQAANMPFFIGEAVKGVRGLARRAYNNRATDVLIDYARDAGFSDEDIEKAKEFSQGDPRKMHDFFRDAAETELRQDSRVKAAAQQRLSENEEGLGSKIVGGALGMLPMIEEFAMTGGLGKALGILSKSAKAGTWGERLVEGLKHSAWMTPVMGSEMARKRYGELTADEYGEDENGNLVKKEGDTAGRALAKAIPGGLGEAAIFSLPIGEAAFGWATPMITKALRTKVGNTVANMYSNYVKYGQMTGLRGQPQMLALMDLNAFKDEVMGLGMKDSEYKGFDAEWKKFTEGEDLPDGTHVPGILSLEGQADMFVSALGVMLLQAGAAGKNAWMESRRRNATYKDRLKGAFNMPEEVVDKMHPELRKMLARVANRLYSGEDALGGGTSRAVRIEANKGKNSHDLLRNEDGSRAQKEPYKDFKTRLERWFELAGQRIGIDGRKAFEEAGKYALKFDNSYGWEPLEAQAGKEGPQSKFKVPFTIGGERREDGSIAARRVVPWESVEVPIGNGRTIRGDMFTDPDSDISVMRYMQTDPKGGDNGYVYLVQDGEGHRATRFGFKDALDAANAMSRLTQRIVGQRTAKEASFNALRDATPALQKTKYVLAKSGAEFDNVLSQVEGKRVTTNNGTRGVTLKDGRVMLCLDRIETPQQMKDTLFHEVGRHRGIDLALPNPADKMGFLAGLARNGDRRIQNQLNTIVEARKARGEKIFGKPIESAEDLFRTDKDGNYDPNAANALEELYAHLFDRGDVPEEPGWWDEHIVKVRQNLRKVFHGLSRNYAEAEAMYRGAMKKLAADTGVGEILHAQEMPTERDVMVQRERERREAHEIGRELFNGGEARRRAENEKIGNEVQAAADERRNAERAEDVRGAFAAEGLKMGLGRERADAERRAGRAEKGPHERAEDERRRGIERQGEIDAQKAEMEDYEEAERQRIERERKEEQDAQDEAELQRLIDAEERETDMAKREEYQQRRREITERRARARAEEKEAAEAEAVRAAQEREKQVQEREEQRKAGYEAADAQARLDRKNAVKQAIREDDARRGEEYDRAEVERKRREAEEEAAGLPRITVEEAPRDKGRTAPQNDVLRVNYGAEDGRGGHQIVARKVTDGDGKVIGWDVNAVEKDGTETLIASTTKPKKDGEAAIRAVRRQIHEHFGLPYGKAQKDAMDAERRRIEESETRKEIKDEARDGADEEPAKPEQEKRDELPPEGEESLSADEGPADAEGEDVVVVHHANEGREGDLKQAGDDALDALFDDGFGEPPTEAPVAEGREEGATGRTERAEGTEGGKSASGGGSTDEAMSFLRNLPPDFKFFDTKDELMDDARRDGNQRLINLIGNLYDQKKVRGFNGFAKMVKDANPALWAEQKERLPALWNYAAELSDGKIPRVGDYEARDAIRSADEGRNVRDISGINALQAALQDIDVEMYPAAQLDRSDARVPNTKLAADPKSGIVPGHELKGRPRSLLSKPILGVEFEDGTVSVGTGRHRAELYSRYGMDIPMRRVREADGWVTKRPDGSYDFTKVRLLDALDNIQDSKGTIEDYVAFFRDVQIPRAEAESEGFLSSKEARTAYALANDAIDDVRNSANFEGGRRAGYISPEQAGAIADAAPKGAWEHNETVQRQLLKDVLKDRTMDPTDIAVDAGLIADDIRREIAKGKVFQMDLFGNVMDAGAELREKKRDYIRDQIAQYERLAKDIRAAKNSSNGLAIKREDMRRLGINERNINKDEKTRRAEYERAAQKAALRAMEWRTGITSQLKPEDRAQMERDLGIEPEKEEKPFALESVTADQLKAEKTAQAQREAIRKGLEKPLEGGAVEDGQTLMDLGGEEGGDLFNRTANRYFDVAEELTPEKNKEYAEWLGKYRLADGPDRRREWARQNPDKATPEALAKAAFEARQYEPAKYKIPGAVKSRTLLEEPPALRATEPPDNDYKLHIPDSIIKKGDLQEHQAEFVGYAGKAHETVRPDGTRLGMMGGYGTGAGKSRMIAGIILDNRNQGRKRALWITTQSGLVGDVRSESKPFGMDGMVYEMFGDKGVNVPKDGIGFGTYHGLRQEGVVEEIAKQLGKDFDGVIAFDEIHRAKTEGGNTQNAVVKLQELLPKARVVYMSATGATDVGNLGYGQRLGLWGEGTAFKDFEDFKKKVENKGVSAMEMVAQTLKRRGQYLSANLSKEGVEFDHVAVPTTDAQKRTYAEYNGALKDVYNGVYDALEAMGRLDYTVPPSSLHGMQQRLHYSMVTALKVPVLIGRAKQELAKGNVPVFSLVNTNEAGATREIAKALERGEQLEMDDVNFGPKQILLDFLTKEGDKSYNGRKNAYKDYQFPTMKPVKDQSGEVIGFERDQIADGIRRRLISEVEKLPDDFGNPINMIIDAFGKDKVANLTGLNRGGMAEDYKAFQDGDKKVLVFSGVANTGYTFSSDRKYKNQARRVAFPLQLGYRADELEQTLGRVHRNNQANAPVYVASTTDLPGERRFYSSVERRRGQMKALTTGDRSASGNGITSEGDNFETKYAQQAVDAIISRLHAIGKLDAVAREMNFIKRTQRQDGSVVEVNGMLQKDKSGAVLPNVPAKRFLNRLLMLDPKRQDGMFTAFKNYLDQMVQWAKDDGEYDIGMQDIGSTRNDAVRSVKLADDMDVEHVNSWFKTDKKTFDDFAKEHAAEFLTYVRNKRTGETFAVRADGKMGRKQEAAAMRYAVDGTKRRMRASILDTEKPNAAYEKLDSARAKELWDAEYGVIPDERADDGFYARGDLLRHWADVLGSKPPRMFRIKAGDAPEYIGAKIDPNEMPAIFGSFGKAEEARDMVIDGKVREVLNNRTVDLVNGWSLKQVPRDGAKVVMVRGVDKAQLESVAKEFGGEVSKKRIFIQPDAAKIREIIEKHPANLYRDDERIGDTGDLRFFDRNEEAGEEERRSGKTYGVPYQGSKNRIADRLVAALPQGRRFVDLFSGGGAVTHAAMESGKYGTYRMNDLDGTGQDLFLEGVRGKWDGYGRKSMTPEEFAAIKGTPEALAWSFNGLGRSLARAEEGGRDKAAEQIRRVQSLSSLKGQADKVVASKTDYRKVKLRKGDVVYADIPYESTDTRGYRKGMEFDKAAFVEWAQKQDVPVFVSEYTMPEGWTEIRSFSVPGMRGGERTEKLFVQSKFADRNGNESLRFMDANEETGDREREREEMRRRWMEGTKDIPVGDRRKFPGIFGDETKVDKAKAEYDALPKVEELPSKADLTDEEADRAFQRHVDSIRGRDEALAKWADEAPTVLPFVDKEGDSVYLVSKDTKEPGKWRVSHFASHNGGMMITGHSAFGTKAEAVKDAASYGKSYDPSVRFFDVAEEAMRGRDKDDERGFDPSRIRPVSRTEFDDVIAKRGEVRDVTYENAGHVCWLTPDGRIPKEQIVSLLGGRVKTVSHESFFPLLERDRANDAERFVYGYADALGGGAIRLKLNEGGIEVGARPTEAQKDRLWDLIETSYEAMEMGRNPIEEFRVDIDGKDGTPIDTLTFRRGTSPARVLKGIDKAYDEGVDKAGQGVRFFDAGEEADVAKQYDDDYRDWLAKYRLADNEKHRAEWERKHPVQEKQTALSGETSLNQNPSGNRYAQAHGLFKPGTRNIDIGAGKFDKATQFLREQGVENIPYDPVNRDAETNRRAAESVRENPADTATVHNVLNVIDNDAVMEGIVNQAARAIKKDGTAIFTIYEGDRSGNGRVTTKGYQRNAKASAYVPVLEKYFGEVETHGNVITARQPKDVGPAFWAEDSSFDRGLRFFDTRDELSPREEMERERRGIGGIYTGTAADYANRSRQGGKDDGPSLHYVGTGEKNGVYGWGLYGSSVRGVADKYANAISQAETFDKAKKELSGELVDIIRENGESVDRAIEAVQKEIEELKNTIRKPDFQHKKMFEEWLSSSESNLARLKDFRDAAPKETVYEQTFFTDRAPGDESHLLKWYEPVSEENLNRMTEYARKMESDGERKFEIFDLDDVIETIETARREGWTAEKLYANLVSDFNQVPRYASNFLARAGIDGVKYPVDSYGGKGVKDGDKVGWNYVSFRDDNIQVDHKWVDGQMRYFNIDEEAARRVHAKGQDEARRMEGAGAGRREIWEKTGWWKGKDGKWRFEIKGISDADTKKMLDFALASGKFYDAKRANVYTFTLNDLEKAMKASGERLPDSVKTLLAAYPKLGTEKIEVDRMAEQPKDGVLGYATSGKKGGTIHLYEQGTTAETLNHELQHRIQEMSGMAGGTNTNGKSFGRYTQEHGEWEARQAATRAEMTDEERAKTAPWETADRHGVEEDMTQIDEANKARIRPDGEPEEPEPADPAMERKTGIFEKAKTAVADRYDPIKQMVIAAGKRDSKAIHNGGDPYDAMRLLHGHNEAARKRYEDIWKRPFEDMLRKSGVTVDDVGMYMISMNAKDRNRKILDRTGALDGAGLSDADADKIRTDLRARLGDAKMGKIEEMADFLWKMQKEGMERRVESGRISREMADQWAQEEPHHVPMRDDLSDEDGEYNRSTRQWRKSDFAKAEGRRDMADNPVEFMFKEYQDAVYGANINEARRALADFVRTTPGIGTVRKGVRRGKAWSFTHKQIEDFPDPNYREQTVKGGPGRPNLVSFKEGGNLYMIELNGKQGERVAEAVIGRGVVNIGASKDSGLAARMYAKGMRAYASTATELSPTFLGRNFVADMIEASLNTMADKGLIKGGASAVKNVLNALRMTRTIRKYITTGRFEGEFADTMRRYVESGASIGGMGNEGYTELKNDLGKVSSGKHGVADVLKFVGRAISNFNKQAELATRLAVFKDYIDGGASDGEAAMRSREYSTDFNKYGNQRWMNSAWMFSGSVIGGAVRQTASLVQGKSGKQLMLGLFAYGVLEGMMEHFYNADEDEKSKKSGQPSGATMTEYNRANSLYFRMGDRFIRAPFHAGPFSVLKYAGNLAARAALGDISGADAAKHIAKEAFDSGMHFTGTGDFNSDTPMQSLLPTLLVPFYQLKGNEDYAGRPIQRRMYSETKPYSENGRKQTGDVWKSIARGMNELTGGNERRRGWFDFSPEKYKFVVDSALKNLGRDITTVSDFVTDLREGKEVDRSHVLFGRDYVRSVPDNTQNFYEAESRYNADRADGTIRQGSKRDEAVKKLLKEIKTLRHWEDGEEKVGGRWVKKRNPSEATKEKHKKLRLRYQQRVIELMKK